MVRNIMPGLLAVFVSQITFLLPIYDKKLRHYTRHFFCAFSKNSRPAAKKLKAHFGQKTQPVGGSFKFQQKNSRNSIAKLLFFSGVTLLKSFLLTNFPYRYRKRVISCCFCSIFIEFERKLLISKNNSRIWPK